MNIMNIFRLGLMVLLIGVYTGCKDDNDGDDNNTLEEGWTCNIWSGTGNWTLTKEPGMDIKVEGEWFYEFGPEFGNISISCPFTVGTATVNGSSIALDVSGTAFVEGDTGNTSAFELTVTGTTSNGSGEGLYSITFDDPLWLGTISGDWTGSRINGSGITN